MKRKIEKQKDIKRKEKKKKSRKSIGRIRRKVVTRALNVAYINYDKV